MSIEIRWPVGPNDDCLTPWGPIQYTAPRPDRDEVGHLMLAMPRTIQRHLASGPEWHHGALHSITRASDRLFAHIDYQGHRWTWELHEAHFADNGQQIYIGRWPD